MTQQQKQRIRRIYYIAISLSLAVAAVCLMAACVSIYRTGDHPFTPDAVEAAFRPIALPVWLSLGLVAVGFVLSPLLPTKDESDPQRDPVTLKRLLARQITEEVPADLSAAIRRQHKMRELHRAVTLGLLAIGAAVYLWYGLDVEHFHRTEINASMIAAMWVLLPCVGIPFAYGVFAAYYNRASIRREIALLKQIPGTPAPLSTVSVKEKWLNVVRYAVIGAALACLIGGAFAGGWADVLTKAINICTECIGLG